MANSIRLLTSFSGEEDELGNLVFLERKAESIRVKGEYVPIPYVEEQFARLDGVEEVVSEGTWREVNA